MWAGTVVGQQIREALNGKHLVHRIMQTTGTVTVSVGIAQH